MQTAHMLPKMTADGSVEWEIIEPNKDGKFKCLDVLFLIEPAFL